MTKLCKYFTFWEKASLATCVIPGFELNNQITHFLYPKMYWRYLRIISITSIHSSSVCVEWFDRHTRLDSNFKSVISLMSFNIHKFSLFCLLWSSLCLKCTRNMRIRSRSRCHLVGTKKAHVSLEPYILCLHSRKY